MQCDYLFNGPFPKVTLKTDGEKSAVPVSVFLEEFNLLMQKVYYWSHCLSLVFLIASCKDSFAIIMVIGISRPDKLLLCGLHRNWTFPRPVRHFAHRDWCRGCYHCLCRRRGCSLSDERRTTWRASRRTAGIPGRWDYARRTMPRIRKFDPGRCLYPRLIEKWKNLYKVSCTHEITEARWLKIDFTTQVKRRQQKIYKMSQCLIKLNYLKILWDKLQDKLRRQRQTSIEWPFTFIPAAAAHEHVRIPGMPHCILHFHVLQPGMTQIP